MFDKLIVSEPDPAEMRHRRSYFMVSTIVVGVLFVTGVVISIFAADISLGSSRFELTELIAPLDLAAPAPEPPRPAIPTASSRSNSQLPTRRDDIQNIIETPKVPDSISTARNTSMERPLDQRFKVGPADTDPVSSNIAGRQTTVAPDGPSGLDESRTKAADAEDTAPPSAKIDPPRPKAPVSKGVVNGIAKELPKPEYSAAARAVRAEGKVDIQVTIDESGKVISARALNGHPLLRPAAESAARRARFSPTVLSDTPVKVTGVIVYNFIR